MGIPSDMRSGICMSTTSFQAGSVVRVGGKYRLREMIECGSLSPYYKSLMPVC